MSNAGHPHFAPAEFAARLERLRGRLRALGVEAALFDEIEAMNWISGYGNSENRWRCVVVPVEKEPFFLIRALDAGPCRRRNWITDVPQYRDWEDPFPVLAERFADRGLIRARVGLDFNSYGMPLARFARLKAALPEVDFVDIGPLIWELRLIKSDAEIGLLRRAAKVADETEMTHLVDEWGHAQLRAGKYTPGQIDGKWTVTMVDEFNTWLKTKGSKLQMPRP